MRQENEPFNNGAHTHPRHMAISLKIVYTIIFSRSDEGNHGKCYLLGMHILFFSFFFFRLLFRMVVN